MRVNERQTRIIDLVTEHGSLRIDDLATILGVSPMTIHRDLDALASQQLITKVRGAAQVMQSALFETGVRVRLARQAREKEALARAVAAHLEPGQAVMLDDSTTCVYLARLLRGHTPITVITNFVPVMSELWGKPGIHLIGLGGVYYEWAEAFMGGMTVDAIRSMSADLLVMSTSAITNLVCYHQSEDTISFKRAMLESTARKILVVDHAKFARRALHALGPVTDFDLVIIDDATPAETREQLRARGVELEVVPLLTMSPAGPTATLLAAAPERLDHGLQPSG
jgi:DeoR/GlpR family transcriptional regulator of sugar metabolism